MPSLAILSVLPTLAGPLGLSPASEPEPPALFKEIGEQALPGVRTTCGSPSKDYILEVNGGGVGLADLDGDGHLDLVVVDGSTLERVDAGEPGFAPRVFLGRGDATFAPAGEAWAIPGGRFGMGLAIGDVDGDGWLDVLITEWGRDRLFRNAAGKGLEAVEAAGLRGKRWGSSAAFFDYDLDARLDLVVINYLSFDRDEIKPRGSGCRWKRHEVMCGPEGLIGVHDQLYRGRGDGTFEETTFEAGFRPDRAGFGLGVTTLDFDADGDTDLYVTNDSTDNHLWANQGDGTFAEVGFQTGVSRDANGKEQAGMGIAAGDIDGDGREDLVVTNFSGETNALYVSHKRGGFRERASPFGLGGPSVGRLGWGTVLFDADLDGDLDLAVVNGHVYPQADEVGTDTSYAQADQLFRYEAAADPSKRGRFVEGPLSDGAPGVSRAAAAGDLDGDGDLDLVVLDLDGPVRVLRNDTPHGPEAHWLRVALRGTSSNRFGLGARVTAVWEGGQRTVEVRSSGGFQAACPPEAHFGLGRVSELERIVVRWPAGREQVVEGPELDRLLVITEESE